MNFTKLNFKAVGFLVLAITTVPGLQYPAHAQSSAPSKMQVPLPVPVASTAEVNNPVPQDYVIGEADVLRISVWKEPELSQTVVVRPDGNISLPLVREIKASGLKPMQLQDQLVARLRAFVVDPQVAVTVTEVHSKNVYITGEVGKAGAYPLFTPTTVLQLIARAGGLTQFANRKGIFVLRQTASGQVRYRFDYREVIRGRSPEQDIVLRSGDTVVVP